MFPQTLPNVSGIYMAQNWPHIASFHLNFNNFVGNPAALRFNNTRRRRRRRHRVVVEDSSVAPVWPRWMAARHRSAGGCWWSWRSWSIQRLRRRPELRTQSRSGRLPSDVSTCSRTSRNAWWAGMLGDILATCPKMASRRLLVLSISISCMRGELVFANVILPADAEDMPLTFHVEGL